MDPPLEPELHESSEPRVRLAPIFQWCVDDPLGILEDYALGEPTLEQVFLKFARRQELLEALREREELRGQVSFSKKVMGAGVTAVSGARSVFSKKTGGGRSS